MTFQASDFRLQMSNAQNQPSWLRFRASGFEFQASYVRFQASDVQLLTSALRFQASDSGFKFKIQILKLRLQAGMLLRAGQKAGWLVEHSDIGHASSSEGLFAATERKASKQHTHDANSRTSEV